MRISPNASLSNPKWTVVVLELRSAELQASSRGRITLVRLSPKIPHKFAGRWEILKAVQSIKVINRQVSHGVEVR